MLVISEGAALAASTITHDHTKQVLFSNVALIRAPNQQRKSYLNIKKLPLADLQFYDISSSAVTVRRQREEILADGVDDIFLTTLLEGAATITHGEVKFELAVGELAVMANNIPYSICYTKTSRRLVLQIPKRKFYERVQKRGRSEFQAITLREAGLVPIIANLFKSLVLETEKLNQTDQYTLAESFLELIGAVMRSSCNLDESPQHDHRAALMRRLTQYMELNYSDCKLTPQQIAEANGISTRYMYRLFRQSGTSVSKWIWERRLKASRENLLDPALMALHIREIAYQCGFNDAAHFSRSFRVRFGISPSNQRKKLINEKAGEA
jgi:AraC-like DNA-binding protein